MGAQREHDLSLKSKSQTCTETLSCIPCQVFERVELEFTRVHECLNIIMSGSESQTLVHAADDTVCRRDSYRDQTTANFELS